MNEYRKAKKSEKLAEYYSQKGHHKKAIKNYLKAISFSLSRQSLSETSHHFLAYEYYLSGDIENAKKYIKKCIDLSPGYIDGKMFYGELLFFMGEKEKGKKIIRECNKKEQEILNGSLDLDAFYNKK